MISKRESRLARPCRSLRPAELVESGELAAGGDHGNACRSATTSSQPGWRSRSRTRRECQRFPGSHCRCLPEGDWGLGALADDVALIVAEFSSSAWTRGDLRITVRLWLQDGVVTIEVSDAPRSPACAFLRERQRACRPRKARPGRLVLG
jgi:hypothetical protein